MRFFSDLSEKNQLIRELFTVHPIKEVCMKFSDYVKVMLMDSVRELIADPGRFARSPGRDFSRNRKIGIRDLLLMLLTMEADCIKEELYRYFGRSTDAPSKAAFYRQRQKLRDDALRSLLLAFNRKCTKKLFKDKYSLVACDGSAADIFRNPSDPDTFYEPNDKSKKGYNQIYINALYSILDKKFVDLVVQPARRHNEYSAFCQMVDRAETENPVIYICDRGYASYNDYAHVIESGQFFLVRCKDVNAQRLLGFSLEGIKAMDYHVDRILSRSVSRKKRLHPELSDQYRHICRNVPMDYISAECPEYHMSLRVVSFQLPGGTFENLITNLPTWNSAWMTSGIYTLSGQGDTRPKCRLLAAGRVNVNRRTSSTPHSVALPATKIRHLGSEGVLRLRFAILQGTGTRRTGRTLSDSNAAESQICGAKPSGPLFTEGKLG